MTAAASARIQYACIDEPLHMTLLELVEAVSDVTDSDAEVVATVMDLLENGQVHLSGNFRGAPASAFS